MWFKDFLAETKKHYSASLESVDFKTSVEEARVNINNWVDTKTQGRFHDIWTCVNLPMTGILHDNVSHPW